MSEALRLVNHSLESNGLNILALNLKAAALRHSGRAKEALAVLASARGVDPLDVRSMAERWLAARQPADLARLTAAFNEHRATANETAAEYMNCGLWKDGSEVLLQAAAGAKDRPKIDAMVYYGLGHFAAKQGQDAKALEYYWLASRMPTEYVFPFQAEAAEVLRAAMKADPRDARAPFYLGNLLFDWQPEKAIALWENVGGVRPVVRHRASQPGDRALASQNRQFA